MRIRLSDWFRFPLLLIAVFAFIAATMIIAAAQSPYTATIVIVVVDQTGAVVRDAKVSVLNTATGAVVAGKLQFGWRSGSIVFVGHSAPPVTVSKEGFGNEELKDITLRSGETATLRVKLLVGSEKAEVSVCGTAESVHVDPQIGRRLDSKQIDETPILG